MAAGLALGACGPLPRPFKQQPQALSDAFRQLDDVAGVVVKPVDGVPPPVAAAIQQALVRRFHEISIPASASAEHRHGHILTGVARGGETTGRSRRLWIDWKLSDRRGKEAGVLTTLHRMSAGGWMAAEQVHRKLVARFALETAPKIVRLLRSNGDHQAPAVLPSKVAIDGITGAPGDGGRVLPIALRTVLRKSGMRIADDPAKADMVLSAAISVEPATVAVDQVRIVWSFRDRQGKLVRRMRQNNRVPKGRLSQPWGPLAYDIAVAMRDSVGETLASLPVAPAGAPAQGDPAVPAARPAPTPAESAAESPPDPAEELLQRLENTQIFAPSPNRPKPHPVRLLDELEQTRIDLR